MWRLDGATRGSVGSFTVTSSIDKPVKRRNATPDYLSLQTSFWARRSPHRPFPLRTIMFLSMLEQFIRHASAFAPRITSPAGTGHRAELRGGYSTAK
ncbi:unnamed protein product [Mycena citricolor]|uniref:Uncharacterized protein n=1 Tax=Mycena citricolor TaxID=2018698 RepID=A0AAD2HZ11_9AGAR|nr:unnamed protein product [Mycena citricolor]